jgi:lipopolysaccharide export LptBFGC system permease protein LptF
MRGFSSVSGTIVKHGGYIGMSILIVVLVALILLGLALYAVQRSPIPSPVNWLIQLVLIVIAIWFIGTRAGFF